MKLFGRLEYPKRLMLYGGLDKSIRAQDPGGYDLK
jgi:hypothetical protein